MSHRKAGGSIPQDRVPPSPPRRAGGSIPQDHPQDRILAAAEACFARSGFAHASMEDIAANAGMRAGNLYRYFPSKAVLILHLVEQVYREIETAFSTGGSLEAFYDALEAVLRDRLATRDRAALLVEIWAEACRNDAVLALCRRSEDRIREILHHALSGSAAPRPDTLGADEIVRAVSSLVSGLLKRRATEDGFASEQELAGTLRLIRLWMPEAAGVSGEDRRAGIRP